mmetsp:Transcript_18446/g.52921  ORF Transcript_18446/g.52921 Transcript_18446/m.52921 type:complete len:526 (-) Transcript_18446:7-1584(-)
MHSSCCSLECHGNQRERNNEPRGRRSRSAAVATKGDRVVVDGGVILDVVVPAGAPLSPVPRRGHRYLSRRRLRINGCVRRAGRRLRCRRWCRGRAHKHPGIHGHRHHLHAALLSQEGPRRVAHGVSERGSIEPRRQVVRRQPLDRQHKGTYRAVGAERDRGVGAVGVHNGGLRDIASRRQLAGVGVEEPNELPGFQGRRLQAGQLNVDMYGFLLGVEAIARLPTRHALVLAQRPVSPGPATGRAQMALGGREVAAPSARRAAGANRDAGKRAVVPRGALDAISPVGLAQRRLPSAHGAGRACGLGAGAVLHAPCASAALLAAGLPRGAQLVAPRARGAGDARVARGRPADPAPSSGGALRANLAAGGTLLRRPRAWLARRALAVRAEAVGGAPTARGARLARGRRRRAFLRAPRSAGALSASVFRRGTGGAAPRAGPTADALWEMFGAVGSCAALHARARLRREAPAGLASAFRAAKRAGRDDEGQTDDGDGHGGDSRKRGGTLRLRDVSPQRRDFKSNGSGRYP